MWESPLNTYPFVSDMKMKRKQLKRETVCTCYNRVERYIRRSCLSINENCLPWPRHQGTSVGSINATFII